LNEYIGGLGPDVEKAIDDEFSRRVLARTRRRRMKPQEVRLVEVWYAIPNYDEEGNLLDNDLYLELTVKSEGRTYEMELQIDLLASA
jgi:hypothetical protein